MDLEPIEERANEFATWVGKFDSEHRIPAAFASAADVPALIDEVKRLRAEVARLTAHPAPAWDEEAAALAVFERSHEPSFEDSEEGMREAREFVRSLAVVRDHLS